MRLRPSQHGQGRSRQIRPRREGSRNEHEGDLGTVRQLFTGRSPDGLWAARSRGRSNVSFARVIQSRRRTDDTYEAIARSPGWSATTSELGEVRIPVAQVTARSRVAPMSGNVTFRLRADPAGRSQLHHEWRRTTIRGVGGAFGTLSTRQKPWSVAWRAEWAA